RLEAMGRAVVARAGAALRNVTDARRRPADGGGRQEAIRWAVVARAGAALRDVTDVRRRAADSRALRVRGALRAAPGAALGDVADAGGRAAQHVAPGEPVRRAVVRRSVTALRHVAGSRGRPAERRALHIRRT